MDKKKVKRTFILAGRLIDGISDKVEENQAIAIEDGRVSEISRITSALWELEKTSHGEIQIVDARDRTVLPGLINGHCHLCFSASSHPTEDVFKDDETILAFRSQQHCAEALAVGVTTVRDCGSYGQIVLKLREAVGKGTVRGSRVVSCGRPVTSTGGHCWFLQGEADGADSMRHMAREILKEGADFIKVMVSGGNMTPGSEPNIRQCCKEELNIAAEEAHMHGKFLSVHVHSTESIKAAFEAGADIFDHCSWKRGDGTDYNAALADKMIEKGIFLCPALGAPYRMDPAQWFQDRPEKVEFWKKFREERFFLTRKMIRSGMQVIGGDDAGCRMTKFYDYWKGLKLMVETLDMSPMEVIRSTTSVTAKAMGMEKRIGSVLPGMEADLLAVDGKQDEDLSCLAVPDMVYQRGKLVAREGCLIPNAEEGE